MSWRGTKNGMDAARAGHDVVMTPTRFCYLDDEQGAGTEPWHLRGGNLPLERVYSFDPVRGLTDEQSSHILGVQGNLWTEFVPNIEYAEYMTWPRAAALAEVGWSAASLRNFEDFKNRIKENEARLDYCKINYRPVEDDDLRHIIHVSDRDAGKIAIDEAVAGAEIHYTLDGSYPTRQSPVYSGSFSIAKPWSDVKAGFFRDGIAATVIITARVVNGRLARLESNMAEDAEGEAPDQRDFFRTRGDLRPGDFILLEFDFPQTLSGITVRATGDAQNAVLEISGDGKAFSSAGEFVGGTADAKLDGKPLAALRIRIKSPQDAGITIENVTLR